MDVNYKMQLVQESTTLKHHSDVSLQWKVVLWKNSDNGNSRSWTSLLCLENEHVLAKYLLCIKLEYVLQEIFEIYR